MFAVTTRSLTYAWLQPAQHLIEINMVVVGDENLEADANERICGVIVAPLASYVVDLGLPV